MAKRSNYSMKSQSLLPVVFVQVLSLLGWKMRISCSQLHSRRGEMIHKHRMSSKVLCLVRKCYSSIGMFLLKQNMMLSLVRLNLADVPGQRMVST